MEHQGEREWLAVADWLEHEEAPEAKANAALLRSASERWADQVAVRVSVHDMLFTPPTERFPFEHSVRSTWHDGLCSLHFIASDDETISKPTSTDDAAATLNVFLTRLFLTDEERPTAE